MALIWKDRVREVTPTDFGGTGAVELAGVPDDPLGFQTFQAAVGDGNSCVFLIDGGDGEWEISEGVYSSGTNTIARTTQHASSAGGTLVNFSTGQKDVVLVFPAVYVVTPATAGEFDTGDEMLFHQSTAPTGWTKSAAHNNKALRVVSGSIGSGGNDAFSTVFGASKTTASHVLSEGEMPAHSHKIASDDILDNIGNQQTLSANGVMARGYAQPNFDQGYRLANAPDGVAQIGNSESVGGGSGHTHDLTLDLQYVDVIIASKD